MATMRLDTIKCFNSRPCVQQEVVNLTLLYFDRILKIVSCPRTLVFGN